MKTGSSKLTSRDLESLFHESGILERRFFPRKVPSPPPDLEAEGNLANPNLEAEGGFEKAQKKTGPVKLENTNPSV